MEKRYVWSQITNLRHWDYLEGIGLVTDYKSAPLGPLVWSQITNLRHWDYLEGIGLVTDYKSAPLGEDYYDIVKDIFDST